MTRKFLFSFFFGSYIGVINSLRIKIVENLEELFEKKVPLPQTSHLRLKIACFEREETLSFKRNFSSQTLKLHIPGQRKTINIFVSYALKSPREWIYCKTWRVYLRNGEGLGF